MSALHCVALNLQLLGAIGTSIGIDLYLRAIIAIMPGAQAEEAYRSDFIVVAAIDPEVLISTYFERTPII